MNPKTTHKIIAFAGMAAVIGVGVVMFTTRSHPVDTTMDTAGAPPASAPPSAVVADVATPSAATPAAVEPAPAATGMDAPGGSAAMTNAATAAAVEPKPRARSPAASGGSTRAGSDVERSRASAASTDRRAAETVSNRVARLQSADVSAPRLTSSTVSAEEPVVSVSPMASDSPVANSPVATATDSQITTDVKTAIAGDPAVKDLHIEVSTTDGVVALTGSLGSQGAIDQAKDVVGKVKDVKRVDTTALIIASL